MNYSKKSYTVSKIEKFLNPIIMFLLEIKKNKMGFTNKVVYGFGLDEVFNISAHIRRSLNAFIGHNYRLWYKEIAAVKLIIVAKLKPETITNLDNKEKEIDNLIYQLKRYDGFKDKQIRIHNQNILKKLVPLIKEYDLCVKKELEVRGYTNQFREDRTNLFGQED